jgi:hypothetical protein
MVKMQSHSWQTPLKLAGLIAILSGVLLTLAAEPPRIAPGTGHDLFAQDLSDADYPAGVWSWRNGELTSHAQDEALWTKAEYENFLLDFEFKLEAGANSGVFLYTTNTADWMKNHVEIQLLDDAAPKWTNVPPNWKCAGLFGHASPTNAAVKPPGEWNHMTIRSEGPKVTVWLNGEQVLDVNLKNWTSGKTNPDGTAIPEWLPRPLAELPSKGRIGFQGAHGGIPTHFRHLIIAPLNPQPPKSS